MTGAGEPAGSRGGFTVAEALVALLLLALLIQIGWSVAAGQNRALRRLAERSAVLSAERTVWWVTSEETASGVPGRDWSAAATGVLELRAYRGWGEVCGGTGGSPGRPRVRYRGWRLPDSAKDSVRVLDGSGRWHRTALVDVGWAAAACPGRGEGFVEWSISPPVAGAVLVRLFERGSYHLEDAAFRYRSGGAGRQPLTGEVLEPERSGFAQVGAGGALLRFAPGGTVLGPAADTGWTRPLGRP